jgi:hypothetical protein
MFARYLSKFMFECFRLRLTLTGVDEALSTKTARSMGVDEMSSNEESDPVASRRHRLGLDTGGLTRSVDGSGMPWLDITVPSLVCSALER